LFFTRTEIKYMIGEKTFRRLCEELSPHIFNDKFFFEKIHTIYYDSEHDEVICHSLEKPAFKEKLRIRAYEQEGQLFAEAFVELKKKYKGLGSKRRLKISLQGAQTLLSCKKPADILGDVQIAKEILFFIKKTSCFPKFYLSSDRYSFRGLKESDLRITFDTNILYRNARLSFCSDRSDEQLLAHGNYLMELKSSESLPLWLTSTLSKYKIYPISFSKYGRAFERHLAQKLNDGINTIAEKCSAENQYLCEESSENNFTEETTYA